MYPDMSTRVEIRFKLVPELGRLVLEIPFKISVPRREITLLSTGSLFVATNANDHRLVIFFLNDCLKGVSLEQAAAFNASNPAVWKGLPSFQNGFVLPNNEIDAPLFCQPIPKGDHFRNFVAGVDVHARDRCVAKKCLSQEPKHHGGVFSNAP